jgi:hypothetical protein
MYALTEAAYLLHDADLAGQTYRLLAPFASRPMLASLGVACFGSAHHALGVAALTFGDASRAAEHFNAAVRDNTALGHWPALALSRFRLACALNSEPNGRDRSWPELNQAQVDADELGMALPEEPWTDRLPAAALGRDRTAAIVFDRQGRHWSVRLGGRSTCFVRHSRGMAYLSVLVANPGQEISATELVIGPEPDAHKLAHQSGAASGQTLLDDRAMREYRERLHVLQEEIDRLDKTGDQARSIEAHAELAWLQTQLRSATGLAGRRRAFTTTDERARIAVSKAIRRAISYIQIADPAVGEILARGITTGRRCVYLPTSAESGSS